MSDKPEALQLADRSPAMRGGTWADDACDELRRLHAFGEQVNAIRNSIIGLQRINWSEHIYPLVAALDEAGFVGLNYDTARANVGTLIERANKAEAERDALRIEVEALRAVRDGGGSIMYSPPDARIDAMRADAERKDAD